MRVLCGVWGVGAQGWVICSVAIMGKKWDKFDAAAETIQLPDLVLGASSVELIASYVRHK